MADEQKIGYVYLNSVYSKGYEITNDLSQATARYKITDPDNMIIYRINRSIKFNSGR